MPVSEEFREVSSESWFSRIGDSFKSVLVGIFLFIIAFPVLFWNEGRAVTTARSLSEGKGALVKASTDKLDAANDGKLIYVVGTATTDETLADADFGVREKGLRLVRKVEMYQWKESKKSEKKKKLGGGTETVTTYTYDKVWSEKPIDSGSFKQRDGHVNPSRTMPPAKDQVARTVKLGAYSLNEALVRKIEGQEPVAIKKDKLPADLAAAKVEGGTAFLGTDPGNPQPGDIRVSISVVRPAEVSIIAGQGSGGTLQDFQTKAGDTLSMLAMGNKSSDSMFASAEAANTTLTWILRLVGFLMMFIGITMVFSPLTTFADIIPFVGDMLGMGVALMAFPVAAGLSLITIAIAWILYRPLVGIGLLVVAIGLIFAVKSMAKGRRPGAPAQAA